MTPDQIILPLRHYRSDAYSIKHCTIDLHSSCLVIVDAWDHHPNPRYSARSLTHQNEKLRPLLSLARKHGIHIVHLPHGHTLSAIATPLPDETVIDAAPPYQHIIRDLLHEHLYSHGIHTLLFAGYASNWCLLNAITPMVPLSYKIILLRDCTIALETPASLSGQWCNYVAINTIEQQWGSSITLTELQRALGQPHTRALASAAV